MKQPILPPTYLLIAMVLILILHFLFPITRCLPSPWNLIGFAPLCFGLVINLLADRAFKKHSTTVNPYNKPSHLITECVFRFSRHPMYLGFVLALLGITILLGTVAPLIVVIGFAILMEVIFIRLEEDEMAREFREEWEKYRSRVRKWI